MKNLLLFVFSAWIGSLFGQNIKRALLIGISEYPGEWGQLHGRQDALLMEKTLQKQGFDPENIYLLLDGAATKTGILGAFGALSEQVAQGDQVFVQFSGHGQQVTDDNNEIWETDGFDECLVPFDCPFLKDAGDYKGQSHLRDDELAELLAVVQQKIGPSGSLFLAIDACHSGASNRSAKAAPKSGTVLRGASKSGQIVPLAIPGTTTKSPIILPETAFIGQPDQPGMAPMVAFFASAAGQENRETGLGYGSLSYYLAENMGSASSSTSYLSLFEKIFLRFQRDSPGQTPTYEGDLNRAVLDGKMLGKTAHFLTTSTILPQFATINEGFLHGLFEGTEVCFYPPDTWDTATVRPIACGAIEKADATGSRIKTDRMLRDDELTGAWASVKTLKKGGEALSFARKMEEMRQIQWDDPRLVARFELVPFICDTTEGEFKGEIMPSQRPDGYLLGDCFSLVITNYSHRELYFAILDFPEGRPGTLLVPDEKRAHSQSSMKPNQTWSSRENGQYSPWFFEDLGTEVIKLVCSDQPFDLRVAFSSRAAGSPVQPVRHGQLFEVVDLRVQVGK